MKYKGFTATIMEARRLKGDQVFGLPPGTPLDVYYADEFLHPPESWMKGPGVFVVPVRPDKGLWFDWRDNPNLNTAVVPTIKGCNPITGMKTSGFHLERFDDKCPKHGCDFLADRFCEKCGYKWPPQNYISSPNTLWWDGFRAEDGTVRQFFFSEEEMRDVASAMIGKKNTVPAFGFAFFSPKEKRAEPDMGNCRGIHVYNTSTHHHGFDTVKTSYCDYSKKSFSPEDTIGTKGLSTFTLSSDSEMPNSGIITSGGQSVPADEIKASNNAVLDNVLSEAPTNKRAFMGVMRGFKGTKSGRFPGELRKKSISKPVKEVSVGAGAKIRQDLSQDTYALDTWNEKPDASITLYFVFQEKFEEIKSKGMRDLQGKSEGMLNNLPVG